MRNYLEFDYVQPNRSEGVTGWNPPFIVKSRVYPASGLTERTGYFPARSEFAVPRGRPRRKASEMVERSLESIAASKRALRRLVYALGPDRMLTLTFRENVEDFDVAYKAFRAFARSWHNNFPTSPVVAVPERQQRGAWHFHLALRGYHDVNVIRSFWKHGAINIKKGKKSGVSAYLAKYLGKDLAVLGRSAYRVINRKYLTAPAVSELRLFLNPISDLPLWVQMEARFSHSAIAFHSYNGIYWRLESHENARCSDSSFVFSEGERYGS